MITLFPRTIDKGDGKSRPLLFICADESRFHCLDNLFLIAFTSFAISKTTMIKLMLANAMMIVRRTIKNPVPALYLKYGDAAAIPPIMIPTNPIRAEISLMKIQSEDVAPGATSAAGLCLLASGVV